MYDVKILKRLEGLDDDGVPNACVCLQVLDASQITADKTDEQNFDEMKVVRQSFTVDAPVCFYMTQDFAVVDIKFEDQTDYDYLQFMDTIRCLEDELKKKDEKIDVHLLLTVSCTQQPDFYLSVLDATTCVQSSTPGKSLNDVIRFTALQSNAATFTLPEEDWDDEEEEYGEDDGYGEGLEYEDDPEWEKEEVAL